MISWWTRSSSSDNAFSIASGFGIVSKKFPPLVNSILSFCGWSFGRAIFSKDCPMVSPCHLGMSNPHICSILSIFSSSKSLPGKTNGSAPISPEPWTPLCPRIGMTPQCFLPINPRSMARLATCDILSVAKRCCVRPILQIKTPELALARSIANSFILSFDKPDDASRSSHFNCVTCCFKSCMPVVWF